MKLTVKEIIKETEEAVSVVLKPGLFSGKVKYKPGQFLTVKVPIADKIEKRAYSFSSCPVTDKFPRITVKKVEKGLVSTYICNDLKVGQKIEVEKAAGSFFVDTDKDALHTYVLFAAGSGITPIFSIAKAVLQNEPLSKVILVYCNRDEKQIIFKEALDKLSHAYPETFYVEHILEHPITTSNCHPGLLSAEVVEAIYDKFQLEFPDKKYMMCGPQGFMDKAKEILYDKGITRDQIKLEAFENSLITPSDAKDLQSTVVIFRDNIKESIQVRGDKTILQGALANNITLPYSCRSGMCSSCKAKCVNGTVKMIDGHVMPQSEVDEGYILTCVSFPTSSSVAISYLED